MKKIAIYLVFLLCSTVFSLCSLPEGEYLETVDSPNGEYQINSYLANGGATVDYAVRCEVVNVKTKEKRNLYWDYHCEEADIEWIDNDNVKINGKELNIHTDYYDWREDN